MAKNEKEKLEFYKFQKEGDSVSRKLVKIFKTQFGAALQIGENLVGLNNSVLMSTVNQNAKLFSKGAEITITMTGKQKGKQGGRQAYKLYEITVNGEKLETGFKEIGVAELEELTKPEKAPF